MNLSDLIYHHKGNLTWDQLAERMPKGTPGKKSLQKMALKPIPEAPTPETIRNLAIAFGIPERVVLDAVGESLGLNVTRAESPLLTLMPKDTHLLTPDQVSAALSMVRSMIDANRAAQQAHTDPVKPVKVPARKSAARPGPRARRPS